MNPKLRHFEKYDKPIFLLLVMATILIVFILSDADHVFRILLVGSTSFIFSTVLNLILKVTLKRQRPQGRRASSDHILTPIVKYSFPSYHAQIGFTMTTVAAMFLGSYNVLFPIVLFALAVFTIYSRLALKAHYKKDVAVGAVIGVLAGGGFFLLLGETVAPFLATVLFASTLGLFFAIPLGKHA